MIREGGKGSGNFGHSGRPGKVGGSSASDNVLRVGYPYKLGDKIPKPFREYMQHVIEVNKQRTMAQKDAINSYVGSLYADINAVLRNTFEKLYQGDDLVAMTELKDYYRSLTKTMLTAVEPIARDTEVFRGVNTETIDWTIGDVIEDKGFTSTSIQASSAIEFSYRKKGHNFSLVRFVIPKGREVIYPTMFSEGEIILPPNSKYRIIAKRVEPFDFPDLSVDKEITVYEAELL